MLATIVKKLLLFLGNHAEIPGNFIFEDAGKILRMA